jgi:thiamine biosynthesis protein ThiI
MTEGASLRAICLISGGIDSPVAAFLMAQRGVEVLLLHMDNSPYSDETALQKVMEIREALQLATGTNIKLYVAPHGRNQEMFALNCRKGFQCVLCKRMMLMVAKAVAERLSAEAIITGESLGQVASQTLHNLRAESLGLDFLVLRPLIGMDKIEIEAIAKRIGTYEISTRSPSTCKIVPAKPVTMAKVDRLLNEESKVDMNEMVAFTAGHVAEIKDPHT